MRRPSGSGELAPLGGQALGTLGDGEAASEQVVDGVRGRGLAETEALAQRLERAGIGPGTQVEVAAEHQRIGARPVHARPPRRPAPRAPPSPAARPRRAGSPRRGARPPPSQGAPTACGAARAARRGSAGGARSTRPGWRTRIWFEPPSLEAIRSGFEVGQRALQRRQPVARGEHPHAARAGAPAELGEPARRRLLQQRHVPVEAVQHAGELVEQRPVDLRVRVRCAR